MGIPRIYLLAAVIGAFVVSASLAAAASKSDDFFWQLQSDDMDLQGPKTCPLHHVGTRFEDVPVVAGMCFQDEEFKRAKLMRFPYSYFEVRSCACEESGLYLVPRLYCPICRRNELRWRIGHGWLIDNAGIDGDDSSRL